MTFLGVLDRYLLHHGFGWPEEVARFLFLWSCCLAAVLAVRRGTHYAVDYLVERYMPGQRNWFLVYAHLLTLIILLVIIYKGYDLTMVVSSQTSPALRISMAYVYVAIPLSSLLMAVFALSELGKLLMGEKTVEN